MKASVIIPAYKSKILEQTLKSLSNQSLKIDFDITVVGIFEKCLIDRFPETKFIHTQIKCPPAKARNMGAINSKSDILIFVDSDCITPRGWIEKILSPFKANEIVAVGGGVKFPEENFWVIADNLSMFHSFLSVGKAKQVANLPSLNLAIRNDIFQSVMGFNENFPFPSGEDFELISRIFTFGKIVFVPEAWVFHNSPRSNLIDMIKHAFIQGKFSTKIFYKNKNFFSKIIFNRISLFFLTPYYSLFATILLFTKKETIKYVYVFPAILLSKFVWCIGAFFSPWQSKEL